MLPLHRSRSPRRRTYRRRTTRRAGFSLIELLVSITIFIILATLALSAFRDSKHDKVSSASRQFSASIGGARSRASKAVEPRGIRFLRDRQDYRLISGMQYIGQSQLYDGSAHVQINSSGVVQLKLPGPPEDPDPPIVSQKGEWTRLRDEGLLKPGARVRIPTNDSGRWYTISSQGFDPANDKLRVVGLIENATWNPSGNFTNTGAYEFGNQWDPQSTEPTFSNSEPIPYLLRLAAHELPETEPINLPPGMVIDLPSSRIPPSWAAFEDTNQNGELDANEDDGTASLPNDNGNGILDDVNFDITLAPNGTVTGPLSGNGPILLYLCARDDVDRMRSLTGYSIGDIPGDFENGYGPDHPSSERRIITIIPQTGLVFVSAVNGVDADNNGYADDPYSFARKGRESR